MKEYDVYSKLTNKLFYVKVGEDEDEKGKYSVEESILYKTGYDDKAILILHELYVNTNFRRECLISLDYLIEKCGYKLNRDNRQSFKNTLEKLKELKLIEFESIDKSNELIAINTEEIILQATNYTQISDEELEVFNNVTNMRFKTTLLKLYLYLKARVFKRSINEKTGETYNIDIEFVPQTTYQSYETIAKYTNIGEGRIKKYIDTLQSLNLITYRKVGYRYKANDAKKKKTDCPNVYAINCLQEDIDEELRVGVKQCKYEQEQNGYVVTQESYKNHDSEKIGLYGSLVKKKNNNKITYEEMKQLKELQKEMQEYKSKYQEDEEIENLL